jgi:hypothetical protein
VSPQDEGRLVVSDPWSTFAGPLGYYFNLTVPHGSTKEELGAVIKTKWTQLGLSTEHCTAFSLTVQRKYARDTKELTRTTAALFIYGCQNIMPHQAIALGKAMGSFENITDKRFIVQEPEVEWFKSQLIGHWFWRLQPSRHEGWTLELRQRSRMQDTEQLEEWMEKTYPSTYWLYMPFVYTDAHHHVYEDSDEMVEM